jgi:predicted transcriptional regulator
LIEIEVIPDTPKRGTKYYKLTPFGELLLKKIHELEMVVEGRDTQSFDT